MKTIIALAFAVAASAAQAEVIDLYKTAGNGAQDSYSNISNDALPMPIVTLYFQIGGSVTLTIDGLPCVNVGGARDHPFTAVAMPMTCGDGSTLLLSYDQTVVKKLAGRFWTYHYTLQDGLIER